MFETMIGKTGSTIAKIALPTLILALAACATMPDAPQSSASMGMLIARDDCAQCHATGLTGDSPNDRAPAFREIASRFGPNDAALATWLKDGHDYPAEMGFSLQPHQVDSLVAYMMRLQADDPAS